MIDYQLLHKLSYNPASYLYERNGIYYFRKRVPLDVQPYFKSKVIVQSLRTRSRSMALRGISVLVQQYESKWMTLRLGSDNGLTNTTLSLTSSLNFTEALELYLRLKGAGKPATFASAAKRNIDYLIDAIDDKDLSLYTSKDAGVFRDNLIEKGLATTSVKRIFSSIKAIYNLSASEHGISNRNPFSNVYFPEGSDAVKRLPFSSKDLTLIKQSCYQENDDLRWLVALIADTGMRLSEAVGLYWGDVCLSNAVPYVEVKPNAHRRLKTLSSTRVLPLVGSGLWALQQAYKASSSPYVFPRYMKGDSCNANSASAAINKWIKATVTSNVSAHSFRHSMRDRLRAIQCPTEIIDACGGWSTDTVGSKYGNGYPIEVLHEWMKKM